MTALPTAAEESLPDADRYEKPILSALDEEEQNAARDLKDSKNLFSALFSLLEKTAGDSIAEISPYIVRNLVLLVLLAFFGRFTQAIDGGRSQSTFRMIAGALAALSLLYGLSDVYRGAVECLRRIRILADASCVSVTSLYALGGNTASAASASVGLSVLLMLMDAVLGGAVPSVCSALLALSAVGGICADDLFHKLIGKIRSAGLWILGILGTVFSAVISLQQQLAQSADSASVRTVRFALSKMIPVVGSSVAEATRTVAAGIGLLRSGAGALGIAAVIAVALPTLLQLLLFRMSFGMFSFFAGAFDIEKEMCVLQDFRSVTDLLLASVSLSAILLFLIFLLLVRSAGTIAL